MTHVISGYTVRELGQVWTVYTKKYNIDICFLVDSVSLFAMSHFDPHFLVRVMHPSNEGGSNSGVERVKASLRFTPLNQI